MMDNNWYSIPIKLPENTWCHVSATVKDGTAHVYVAGKNTQSEYTVNLEANQCTE